MIPDRTYASLILSGSRLSPGFWTAYFGLTPDRKAVNGGDYTDHLGRKIASNSRRGLWILSTEGRCASHDANDHVACLRSLLSLPRDGLDRLLSAQKETLLVSIFVSDYNGSNRQQLSRQNELLIEACGGQIEFDVYPQIHQFVDPDGEISDVIV